MTLFSGVPEAERDVKGGEKAKKQVATEYVFGADARKKEDELGEKLRPFKQPPLDLPLQPWDKHRYAQNGTYCQSPYTHTIFRSYQSVRF